jgi:hypothetical protein
VIPAGVTSGWDEGEEPGEEKESEFEVRMPTDTDDEDITALQNAKVTEPSMSSCSSTSRHCKTKIEGSVTFSQTSRIVIRWIECDVITGAVKIVRR